MLVGWVGLRRRDQSIHSSFVLLLVESGTCTCYDRALGFPNNFRDLLVVDVFG